MEAFVVSALKYRPQQFADVVGQQAITQTLENAIAKDQLPQALLFCGPRGVGKTTCARILAKKINTQKNNEGEQDFAFNIFELDAASNNSVDDIRKLNEQVRIPPQTGSHKIYIIDEVHMLSTSAFNAFLKTLEEPPKHVIFILATTEKHKIIPTILSRCQIFEFKRITPKDVQLYLANIAKEQGVAFEEEALHLIGQKADGAMRDALSIYDRMCSFCNNNLTISAVAENLNILDHSTYLNLVAKLIAHEIPEALIQYDAIVLKGFDGEQFISGLASHLRNLYLCKDPKTIPLLDIGERLQSHYAEQTKLVTLDWLADAMDLANSCELSYKNSQNKRLHVELCLMQIASLHFDGEKKGSLIPTSFFLQSKSKTVSAIAKTLPTTLAEPKAEYQPKKTDKEIPATNAKRTAESSPVPASNASTTPENLTNSKDEKQISSYSLASIRKKKEWEQQQKPAETKELPNDPFTQKQLEHYWNKWQEQKINNREQNLASLFQLSQPKIVEPNSIEYTVPSALNKVELEREFVYFLPYIREGLNNYSIQIKVLVKETEEKNFIYTTEEKYNRLREINPSIDELRKKLDLDI